MGLETDEVAWALAKETSSERVVIPYANSPWLCKCKHNSHYKKRLLSYLVQCPSECCPFIKTFSYICNVDWFWPFDITYCESVFSQVLTWKCGSFLNWKDGTEQHSLRVDTWDRCILYLDTPYLLRCGVLCRLFPIGSFHNLHVDKRKSAPHFLFIYPLIFCRSCGMQTSYGELFD